MNNITIRHGIRFKIPNIEDFMLGFYVTQPVWRYFIFSKIPGGGYIVLGIIIGLILFSCRKKGKALKSYQDILWFYLIVFFLFFLKFTFDSSMSEWISRPYGLSDILLSTGLLSYAVFRLQISPQNVLNVFKISGVILLFYYGYQSLEVLRNGYWTYYQFGAIKQNSSNMSWSYGVLLSVSFLSAFFFIEKKRIVLIPISIGMFGVLVYGSRGTVIAFIFGVVMCAVFVHDGKLRLKNFLALIIVLIALFIVFSSSGLNFLSSLLEKYGFQSEAIDTFLYFRNIEEAGNGRALIWARCLSISLEHPLLGLGVMGERNMVYNLGYQWGYSHNVFLEILIAFGWPIGLFLILKFIHNSIKLYFHSFDICEKLIYTIMLTYSFELIMSNTIWIHIGIWSLLALYRNHFKNQWYSNIEYSK